MENELICSYTNCSSQAYIACNCASSRTLLCHEHTSDHTGDKHSHKELYLILLPEEQEAFYSAQALLFSAGNIRKEEMASELEETMKRILQELEDAKQSHSKNLTELAKNVAEIGDVLNEVGRFGIPTFKEDDFSVRLEALKRNNQVISYSNILKEVKNYWRGLEQRGMSPLSHLIKTQELIREHEVTTGGHFMNISFSSDGKYYAAGSKDNTIKVWSMADGELLHSLVGHSDSVFSVAFAPDSGSLASGSADNTIRIWKVSDGQTVKLLKGHSHWVHSIVFSNSGDLIASGSYDMTIKLWRVKGLLLRSLQGHSDRVCSVCFSHDDKLVASGGWDFTIKIWDVASGKERETLSSHTYGVNSVCFARNSSLLVSGSADNTLKLWDVESGEMLHTFEGHSRWVFSVMFSPDDQFIASGGKDQAIKIWKVAARSLVTTFNQHSSAVVAVNFSPDGLILASRDDSKLKLVRLD